MEALEGAVSLQHVHPLQLHAAAYHEPLRGF
jgi:hypothetical protein